MPEQKQIAEIDWARLAAYIDGEGAILLNKFSVKHKNSKSMWVRVIIANTDPRLPLWCKEIFGGCFVAENRKPKKPNHRPAYRWHVSCRDAHRILLGCYPYLLIKREQADIAIAFQRTLAAPGKRLENPAKTHTEREEMRLRLHSMKRVSPLFKPDEGVEPFEGKIN